jgi:hypothetical protein
MEFLSRSVPGEAEEEQENVSVDLPKYRVKIPTGNLQNVGTYVTNYTVSHRMTN